MSMTPREQLASAAMIATHEIVLNLEKAKSSLESLIDGMQDLTCLITTEGRIVWGNQRTASWLDVKPDLVHLYNIQKLFSPKHWSQFREKLQSFKVEGHSALASEFEVPVQKGAGSRELLWNVRPFKAVSTRRGCILLLVGRDITEVLWERAERSKLESELETAQIMQAAFFPPKHIKTAGVEICSYYKPAVQCSGDWWGHFNFGEGLDLICIGDVTGHGAPSALVTAMTQATCLAFAHNARGRHTEDCYHPSRLLDLINKIVYETFKGEFFMTFLALLFDTHKGVVRACNAGHNFPLFLRGKNRSEPNHTTVQSDSIKSHRLPEVLIIQGNPIGFDPGSVYQEKETSIEDSDRYVIYTDGLIECKNEQGTMYGTMNFRKSIAKCVDTNCVDFRDKIVQSALSHYGNEALADDLTIAVIDVFLKNKTN
ncbi:MAG: SpoIIE family protein phosphatase [Proteobacteria bacterium]|nr:SpoIIE family protein phosphatase [Pseudomonadota bacterium]